MKMIFSVLVQLLLIKLLSTVLFTFFTCTHLSWIHLLHSVHIIEFLIITLFPQIPHGSILFLDISPFDPLTIIFVFQRFTLPSFLFFRVHSSIYKTFSVHPQSFPSSVSSAYNISSNKPSLTPSVTTSIKIANKSGVTLRH